MNITVTRGLLLGFQYPGAPSSPVTTTIGLARLTARISRTRRRPTCPHVLVIIAKGLEASQEVGLAAAARVRGARHAARTVRVRVAARQTSNRVLADAGVEGVEGGDVIVVRDVIVMRRVALEIGGCTANAAVSGGGQVLAACQNWKE